MTSPTRSSQPRNRAGKYTDKIQSEPETMLTFSPNSVPLHPGRHSHPLNWNRLSAHGSRKIQPRDSMALYAQLCSEDADIFNIFDQIAARER
jgi:hypothetical protein